MELKQLPGRVNEWLPGFLDRFPARITVEGIQRFWLLTVLYLLDSVHPQRFRVDPAGTVLFSLDDVAKVFGIDGKVFAGLAVNWWVAFGQEQVQYFSDNTGQLERWISFGGLVPVLYSIQPTQLPSFDRVDHLARLKGVIEGLLETIGATSDEAMKLNALFDSGQARG